MVEFAGFSDARYQQHDSEIRDAVLDFNSNKAARIGCTEDQAELIPDLTEQTVKAWLIEESGGGDVRSRAAWQKDPAQVNVPGDWGEGKTSLGLTKPKVRNEGDLRTNLRAAVAYLARKGFGRSGQAPKAGATFDGWTKALERYNGRSDQCVNGKIYRVNYANQIMSRANDPKAKQDIGIKVKKD